MRLEAVLASTSLPSPHVALVHFPIALLIVAVAFELAAATGRFPSADRSAIALWLLGAAAAWLAVLTGQRAADALVGVPALVQPRIGEHHDWAVRTAGAYSAVALVRVASVLPVLARAARALRVVAVAGGIAGWMLLLGTADRGGALVYRHGLGVVGVPGPTVPESETATTPAAGELVAGTGSSAASAGGIVDVDLHVLGPTLLMLPGQFGDVEVRAELDLSGFNGRVGPACRIRDLSNLAVFEYSTDGSARLLVRQEGSARSLDEGDAAAAARPEMLALSSAGRHYKGLADGATVVHGHAPPLAPGGAGLFADGEGIVRVRRLEAIRLDEKSDHAH